MIKNIREDIMPDNLCNWLCQIFSFRWDTLCPHPHPRLVAGDFYLDIYWEDDNKEVKAHVALKPDGYSYLWMMDDVSNPDVSKSQDLDINNPQQTLDLLEAFWPIEDDKTGKKVGEYKPDYVSSPGETIRDTLREKGMSITRLSKLTNMSMERITSLLDGKLEITTHIAVALEQALNVPAYFWLDREAKYRESLCEKNR